MKKWIDKKFNFNFPDEKYQDLILRLRNTISKIYFLISLTRRDVLTNSDDGKWSIQENVGHLYNSDLLFIGRLEDYFNKLENLRPADLSGKKTNAENFNEKGIELILKKFEERRGKYLAKLESLNIEVFARSAFHPRLNQQMRLCDMLYFQAEHDEYHLSRIFELIEKYNAAV